MKTSASFLGFACVSTKSSSGCPGGMADFDGGGGCGWGCSAHCRSASSSARERRPLFLTSRGRQGRQRSAHLLVSVGSVGWVSWHQL